MGNIGPLRIACFFLYSGESLSSGFEIGAGPPGFLAEFGPAGALGLVGDRGVWPLGKVVVPVFILGNPPGVRLIESSGDRRG